ncbi:hypothetical protein CEUSTIGMA_g3563.t1 [Chlamydomonas eustigma]|uniref:Uncharacterized protein n=1 Tax=Chlamydomonas eustigma TaxID=1157962 RepID=A0A250X040_9CHLO|nr:hypothetical protein CEUSTIGMA_g3563.t1 [Chlamydomonas eustigma]|eukprot:GAX76120.1 hypothetical protein CEUSTIGMA_g3563.t1 [Chlamydomonas eustigma]
MFLICWTIVFRSSARHIMAFRTVTYAITNEGGTGFSAIHDEPHMSELLNQRQTEMWANNKRPYFASYAPSGVTIYPDQRYLPWKKREYFTTPPTFEGTRFRFTKGEMSDRTATLRTSQQLQANMKHGGNTAPGADSIPAEK